jgi:hypothetical protein
MDHARSMGHHPKPKSMHYGYRKRSRDTN